MRRHSPARISARWLCEELLEDADGLLAVYERGLEQPPERPEKRSIMLKRACREKMPWRPGDACWPASCAGVVEAVNAHTGCWGRDV